MAKSPKKIFLRVVSIIFGILFLVGTYRSISKTYQVTPEQQIALAEARVKEKKWDEALAALADARKKAPNNYRIDFLEGNIHRAQKDLPKALASFEAARAKNPNEASVHQLIGITKLALKQNDGAEAAFLEAVKVEPANYRAHTNLGVYYSQIGKTDKAIASLEQAVKIRPSFGEAHHILGNIYKEQKNEAKTREHYEAFMARKPRIPVQEKVKIMLWLKKHPDPNKPKTEKTAKAGDKAEGKDGKSASVGTGTVAAAKTEASGSSAKVADSHKDDKSGH